MSSCFPGEPKNVFLDPKPPVAQKDGGMHFCPNRGEPKKGFPYFSEGVDDHSHVLFDIVKPQSVQMSEAAICEDVYTSHIKRR